VCTQRYIYVIRKTTIAYIEIVQSIIELLYYYIEYYTSCHWYQIIYIFLHVTAYIVLNILQEIYISLVRLLERIGEKLTIIII
jgi:hypothetical protein